jgi:hypothetical protein
MFCKEIPMKLSVLFVILATFVILTFFYPRLCRWDKKTTEGYRIGMVQAGSVLFFVYLIFRDPMFLNLF